MAETARASEEYGADSIKVLKGLDAVRKRPGMYIGDTDDGSGLHHMVYEVVDNGIDEALAGHATEVSVNIHADNSVSVRDNGRGIPVDIHEEEGVSAAEVIMTQLHAGGKFDQNTLQGLGRPARRRRVGRQRAVGLAGAAGLAQRQRTLRPLRERRHGGAACTAVGPAAGQARDRGALPGLGQDQPPEAPSRTSTTSSRRSRRRLRELAFLNSGVRITLDDERPAEPLKTELFYEGGVREFVKYLDRSKTSLHRRADLHHRRDATASASRSRCGGTTATTRRCCPSPTTSRSATAAPISPAFAAR